MHMHSRKLRRITKIAWSTFKETRAKRANKLSKQRMWGHKCIDINRSTEQRRSGKKQRVSTKIAILVGLLCFCPGLPYPVDLMLQRFF